MRGARGQATVDYLAVVLVVAAVVGAAAAALATTGLGEHVVAAFRHALCVVTGGPCDDEAARACVRSSHQHVDDQELDLSVIHLGGRDTELREHLSDGTVAVSLIHDSSAGAVVGAGARLSVRWGSYSRAIGSELRIAALAEHTSGRTWVVADDAAANRLITQVWYADPSMPIHTGIRAPVPAQTFAGHGGGVTFDLGTAGGRSLHLDGGEAYGERQDRSTGRRTIYVRNTAGGSGAVAVGLTGGGAAAGIEERYGITLDRQGRPLDLEVLTSQDVSGSVGLPPQLARIAGWLQIPAQGARHLETEQHLDLTDPANAMVVRTFLGDFGRGALGVKVAANALRRRLERDGTTRVRTYDQGSDGIAVGGHVGAWLFAVGGRVGSEDSTTRLRRAMVREPGGAWRPDEACLPTSGKA